MDPTRWGPKLWFIMHTFSFNYPDNPTQNDKDNITTFFNNLKNLIPCELCRNHYIEHLKKNPVENNINNKNQLINWVIELHNQVNISIGKPPWTLEQAINYYQEIFSSKCNISESKCKLKPLDNTNNYAMYIHLIILFITIVAFLLILNRKN